ncbi:hypothetical protein LC085_05370 [Bacillus tianshenii]|uniref:hypothetical protein n=1 Tax=Sutcliffiella tianshenii TaxID=1463404 RepID=UPI001CD72DB5|nr:hypothetical protein [Bacillus tianshenii]MCA1319337.1 hypothetical protein [Bacillus tianshenii]
MDLYCTKHKKRLSERYDPKSTFIEIYCVDCEMEQRYQTLLALSTEERKQVIRKFSYRKGIIIAGGVAAILLLPLPLPLKIVSLFICSIIIFKVLIEPLLFEPAAQKPLWEDVRAKALNQSSIQANQVDNVKRQWKKGFLQERKNKKWTEEEWQQYLRQFYKK